MDRDDAGITQSAGRLSGPRPQARRVDVHRPMNCRKLLDITVLLGGPSSERNVSLVSGEAIASALERLGHQVLRADISPDNTVALDRAGIDVVFIALHGQFGESGDVQALCEKHALRYTGSGVRASEIAIDKDATKRVCRWAGITTPDWVIADGRSPCDLPAPPVVLKPIDGGSSVDITIAETAQDRDAALAGLLAKYGRAMVERYVRGREFTVGILGDQALPVLEIVPRGKFYDLHAKYDDDAGTVYNFEHGLSERMAASLQEAALASHRAVGCRDMSRVDFIVDGRGAAWLLEINTIPGFTSHSLLPKAAARIGIGFDELVERIVTMALRR